MNLNFRSSNSAASYATSQLLNREQFVASLPLDPFRRVAHSYEELRIFPLPAGWLAVNGCREVARTHGR